VTQRWALFISGGGTTAQAVMDCSSQVDVRLVVSSRKSAFGLVRARRWGVPSYVLEQKIDWDKLQVLLESYRIQRIFLLGFMKILPADFCEKWKGKILNVHPSLLPQFKGAKAFDQSFTANQPMGVSIHQVTAGMDEGPLVYQQKVIEKPSEVSESRARIFMGLSEQFLIRKVATLQKARPV